MKEYIVEITETLQRQVKIKAKSKEEAEKTTREKYKKEEIVLNENDFIQADFAVINEHKIRDLER